MSKLDYKCLHSDDISTLWPLSRRIERLSRSNAKQFIGFLDNASLSQRLEYITMRGARLSRAFLQTASLHGLFRWVQEV